MTLRQSLVDRAENIRIQVQAIQESGQKQYDESLRREVLACLKDLRASGVSFSECKGRLGVSRGTLYEWRAKYSDSKHGAMVRVHVCEDKPKALIEPISIESNLLILRTPDGYELTGFNIAQAAELLRRLR